MSRPTDERSLFYERFATDFDDQMHSAEVGRRLDLIFEEVLTGELAGSALLDAGCGTGLFSARAAHRGANVTSLDVGPNLLAEVAKKCDSERVVGDVQALPFPDASFDVVVSTEVIEHTPEPARAIRELVRVAKPGGTVVITTPNRTWLPAVQLSGGLGLRPYHGRENWISFGQLAAALRDAGVSRFELRGFNAVPVGAPSVQRLLRRMDQRGHTRLGRLFVNMLAVARR
jgi:SAM-dependent methyltransferase